MRVSVSVCVCVCARAWVCGWVGVSNGTFSLLDSSSLHQGAAQLLCAMFENNYDLCSGNNFQFLQQLVDTLMKHPAVTSRCMDCLTTLVVVDGAPVHGNQQQILQILVAEHGGCLQKMQNMTTLPRSERRQLCSVVELLCTCCTESTAHLAHGLVPLPWLLKILQETNGLEFTEEQGSLLRCLNEVWWTWRDADTKWWARTESWWDLWWQVVDSVDQQVQEFSAQPLVARDDAFLQHVLNTVIPCLTVFFKSCSSAGLNDFMDENRLAQVRSIGSSLHEIYQPSPSPPPPPQQQTRQQGISKQQSDIRRDFVRSVSHLLDEEMLDCLASLDEVVISEPYQRPSPVKKRRQNDLLTILHTLQTQSVELYPTDALDTQAEFDLKLLGLSYVNSEADAALLETLMTKMTEKVMGAGVQIGLLSCFTGFLEPHRRSAVADNQQDPLRAAQLTMADSGATRMAAIVLQHPARQVFAAAIAFATNLFWGGNPGVQDALLQYLETDDSQAFLRVLSEKVQLALPTLLDWKAENLRARLLNPPPKHPKVLEFEEESQQPPATKKKEVEESTSVLRLLQLLCEGHHLPMQNFLRKQPHSANQVNVVDEVVRFLKELIAFEMDSSILPLVIQTFNTLTEFCQGPCPDNQAALVARGVTSDANRILQIDVHCDPKLVFEMRCAATLTLLSLLEGCNDPSRPKLIASTIQFTAMRDILDSLWDLVKHDATSGVSLPDAQQDLLNLAFNLFILLYQLQSVSANTLLLESCSGYTYFRSLLGIIEIARGNTLEKVYFQIPSSCMYLRRKIKDDILNSMDRTSPITKVTSFLDRAVTVGSKIAYHRKVTEWLEECLPLRDLSEEVPELKAHRTYFIHHRDKIREKLRQFCMYLAIFLNFVVAFLRRTDSAGGGYNSLHYTMIWLLGFVMLGMNCINSVLWLMAKAYNFKEQVVSLCLCFVTPADHTHNPLRNILSSDVAP